MRDGWSLVMGWKMPLCWAKGESRSPMPTAARATDVLIIVTGVGRMLILVSSRSSLLEGLPLTTGMYSNAIEILLSRYPRDHMSSSMEYLLAQSCAIFLSFFLLCPLVLLCPSSFEKRETRKSNLNATSVVIFSRDQATRTIDKTKRTSHSILKGADDTKRSCKVEPNTSEFASAV